MKSIHATTADEPEGAREQLAAAIGKLGCRFALMPGGRLRVDCPSQRTRVELLDLLAWHDSRFDDRVRRLAVAIAAKVPSDAAGRVDASKLPEALHRAVRERVRFLDEGPETMASAWSTWETGVGDCDDSARLLLALARSVAVDARLALLVRPPDARGDIQPDHASVVMYDGTAWRWAEPSIRGARFGEEPRAAARRTQATRAELGGVALGAVGVGGVSTEAAAVIVERVWPRELLEPSPFAVQVALAIARHETGYGAWPAGSTMEGSNNWGAVQCTERPIELPWIGSVACASPGCALHGDRFPDGRSFRACFRRYASHDEGAADFLRHLVKLRPLTRAGLARGASARDVCAAMHREHYFGGLCPEAVKAGAEPKTTDPRCAAEAIDGYADAVRRHAAEVAARLGQPDAVAAAESSRSVGLGVLVVAALAGGAYAAHRARWF